MSVEIDEGVTNRELELIERVRSLEEALGKINEVRNNIVRNQNVNWSADIYPLVAALNSVGFQQDPAIGEEWEKKHEEFVKQFCPECLRRLPEHEDNCSKKAESN